MPLNRILPLLLFVIGLWLSASSCISKSAQRRVHLVSSNPNTNPSIGFTQGTEKPGRQTGNFFADWRRKNLVVQGFLGIVKFHELERRDGNGISVDAGSEDLALLPLAGGGVQRRFGGEGLAYGLECLGSASGRSNERLQRVTGTGGSSDVTVDLFLLDLYGGVFLSASLGDRWRAYGALGPLLQLAQWDETEASVEIGSKGLGLGAYGRIGFEYVAPSRDLIGIALRWSDVEVNLGSGRGDLELGGLQLVFSVSRAL